MVIKIIFLKFFKNSWLFSMQNKTIRLKIPKRIYVRLVWNEKNLLIEKREDNNKKKKNTKKKYEKNIFIIIIFFVFNG